MATRLFKGTRPLCTELCTEIVDSCEQLLGRESTDKDTAHALLLSLPQSFQITITRIRCDIDHHGSRQHASRGHTVQGKGGNRGSNKKMPGKAAFSKAKNDDFSAFYIDPRRFRSQHDATLCGGQGRRHAQQIKRRGTAGAAGKQSEAEESRCNPVSKAHSKPVFRKTTLSCIGLQMVRFFPALMKKRQVCKELAVQGSLLGRRPE